MTVVPRLRSPVLSSHRHVHVHVFGHARIEAAPRWIKNRMRKRKLFYYASYEIRLLTSPPSFPSNPFLYLPPIPPLLQIGGAAGAVLPQRGCTVCVRRRRRGGARGHDGCRATTERSTAWHGRTRAERSPAVQPVPGRSWVC